MNDLSSLNNLTTEEKIVIANAQTLVNEVKEMMSSRKYQLDMTSIWQLKSDCRDIEYTIKDIKKGKKIDKKIKKLEAGIVRLRTNLNGIISYHERG